MRRELLRNRVPTVPGGGTVDYVNPVDHHYIADPAHREEGGTPAIVESIRAGLVFGLKQAVGTDVIRAHEEHFLRRAVQAWQANPNLQILGNVDADRLSILSFVVRRPGGRYLHHNFVVAAAQRPVRHPVPGRLLVRRAVRAPPARHRPGRSHRFEQEIIAGCEGIKPGLGPGQLQLLHLRGDVPLHRGGGRPGRHARLAAAAASTASTRPPDCGGTGAVWSSRRCACPSCATTPTGGCAGPSRHERAPESALADYLAEARELFAKLAEQPDAERRAGAGRRGSRPASRSCAGSTSPTSA